MKVCGKISRLTDWIQLFQLSVRMWDNWRGNFLKIVEWLLLLFVLEFGSLFLSEYHFTFSPSPSQRAPKAGDKLRVLWKSTSCTCEPGWRDTAMASRSRSSTSYGTCSVFKWVVELPCELSKFKRKKSSITKSHLLLNCFQPLLTLLQSTPTNHPLPQTTTTKAVFS